MHILRVRKNNGYSIFDLQYPFNSLIMSLFTSCIRVWGVAAYSKYLSEIDRPQKRVLRFGYIQCVTSIKQIIKDKDLRLWSSTVDNLPRGIVKPTGYATRNVICISISRRLQGALSIRQRIVGPENELICLWFYFLFVSFSAFFYCVFLQLLYVNHAVSRRTKLPVTVLLVKA